MTERQHLLLRLIETAFVSVELGDGVSLHESAVLDDYGSAEERQTARALDEKYDWRKLVGDPELVRPKWKDTEGMGGLNFYDAAGLRFHLPAYLSVAVIEPEGNDHAGNLVADLLLLLTHFHLSEYNQARFAILNPEQRACVGEVLSYLRDMYDYPDNGPLLSDIDQAVEDYWNARG